MAAADRGARPRRRRYADTGLILDAVLEHGFGPPTGRAAIRRMNQMHGSYAISNDDIRYVQSTFVVIPIRWLERFGWRPPTEYERRASLALVTGFHPRPLRPLLRRGTLALLDPPLREAFRYPDPGRATTATVAAPLRPRRPRVRHLPRRLRDPGSRDVPCGRAVAIRLGSPDG